MYRYKNKTVEQYRREYYSKTPPETTMYNGAKARAKRKGLVFTIDKADIVIPLVCPYLGIPLVRGNIKVCDGSPSLDRKDSSLGYTKENVEVISHKANTMKSNVSKDQLIHFAKTILEKFDLPEPDG